MEERNLLFLYRIHEPPSQSPWKSSGHSSPFRTAAEKGIRLFSREFQRVLLEVKDRPEEKTITTSCSGPCDGPHIRPKIKAFRTGVEGLHSFYSPSEDILT